MTIKAFRKLLQDFCVMGRFMALPAVRNLAMFVMALGTVNLAMEACRTRPFLEYTPMTRTTGGIGCFCAVIGDFFRFVDWMARLARGQGLVSNMGLMAIHA